MVDATSRKALTAWFAWWLLRRRLRRSDHTAAALGVVALDLLGPRLFRRAFRHRVIALAVALTVVGLVVLGAAWLIHRRRGNGGDWGQDGPEPLPPSEPPAVHVDEPAVPVGA